MTGKERFIKLKEYLKTDNLFDLSKKIGVSRNALAKAEFRSKPFSDNLARKITKVYPEIRFEWLIDGVGEMLDVDHLLPKTYNDVNTVPKFVNETENHYNLSPIDKLINQNSEILKQNSALMETINQLVSIQAQQTRIIGINSETINNLSSGPKNVPDVATPGG